MFDSFTLLLDFFYTVVTYTISDEKETSITPPIKNPTPYISINKYTYSYKHA